MSEDLEYRSYHILLVREGNTWITAICPPGRTKYMLGPHGRGPDGRIEALDEAKRLINQRIA